MVDGVEIPAVPVGARRPASAREAAFEELFQREHSRLAGYCWSLVDDREAAADLVQEAFARLLARWVHVREPEAYLFRIATNLAQREWRRRARDRAADVQPTLPPDQTEALAIRQAVWRLPKAQREVIWLFYFADQSVEEIARILGRRAGTVKWLLSCGRDRLALRLGDHHG